VIIKNKASEDEIKKFKNLKKKLDDIEKLKSKINNG